MVTTIWQAAYALASGFSSLMGYAFINVKNSPGSLRGWQWLHILVGILSASSTGMPNFPLHALHQTYPDSMFSHHLDLPTRLPNKSQMGDRRRESQVRGTCARQRP